MPSILILIVLIGIAVSFGYPFITSGLGYAPSTTKSIERMIRIARVRPGEKVVDIGSGDGRVVIALAQAGAEAHGYEVNPMLVWLSRWKIKRAGLQGKAFIHGQSFWKATFNDYSVVTLFAVSYIMKNFEKKLQQELKPGSRIVTNYFVFPQWLPEQKEHGVTLYIKK